MKNIIFFGILLLAFQHKAFSKDIEIYCLSKNSNTVFSAIVNEDQLRLNNLNKIPNKLCEMSYASADSYLQIPKKIFDEIKKEQDYWSSRAGDVKKVQENFFGLGPKTFYHYGNDPDFKRSWNEALQTKVDSKMNEINSFQTEIENQSIKQSEIENKKIKQTQIQPISNKEFKIIDSKFSKNCEGGLFSKGYKKGTVEFNECVKREEKFAALDMQKKELMNEEKNKKIALQQETQKKVTQKKQELDQAKIKEEQIRVSKMNPEDRHSYTCSEKFGFRKGSDKFKDCVFKIYQAEIEMEKLELQRELAKANAETAKLRAEAARASEERQERLLQAQTETAKMQALAARQQAIAANTADSLALMEFGLRMLTPQQPAPRLQTNCFYHARYLSCH